MVKFKPCLKRTAILLGIITLCYTQLFATVQRQINVSSTADSIPALNKLPEVLPKVKNSFLEQAEMSTEPSGFKIRGTKGWSWSPEQYLDEIPVLAKYKMNFLMNCYISMFTQPLPADSLWRLSNLKNEWWLPLTEAKKKAYEKVFAKSREYGIVFCFGIHAQLATTRPANLSSEKDFEDIWQHYAWAQSKGIRWFSIPLDDVNEKYTRISGAEHARFVNKILARLRIKDKDAQMVFCPTYYYRAVPNNAKERQYLEELAATLDKDVYVFWTGPSVVPATVTLADAIAFKSIIKHRVILWDNYPVNDASKTLHLGPLTGRDRFLSTVIDGYMSNPHFEQNDINRIPLFTIADYTYDPIHYDPARSIGQAIIHQTDNLQQQKALLELTRLYSNPTVRATAFNPVLDSAKRLTPAPNPHNAADAYLAHLKKVQAGFQKEFPNQYSSTKKILSQNIKQVESGNAAKYK